MEHILNPTYCEIYDKKTRDELKNNFSKHHDAAYLDHAGATLYADVQMKNIFDDLTTGLYGNPHSATGTGNQSQEIVENTRFRILDFFHASTDEYSLIFTSGATASLKIIAECFKFVGKNGKFGNFVYLQDNHTSVLGMRDLVSEKGAKIHHLKHNDTFKIFNSANNNMTEDNPRDCDTQSNSLFVYSAQCNFSGFKYPLNWIEKAQQGLLNTISDNIKSNWFVLLDAAAFVGTNQLDLSIYKPDFVVMSFYKMFGYPTGIGALIIKNSSAQVLNKVYYGGGTVNMALSTKNFHIKKNNLHQRFEDGTVSFLSIISLQHGLDQLSKIPMTKITTHVFALAQFLHHSLLTLHHSNGNPVIKLYTDSDYEDPRVQGGIVTFNILRSNSEYVGYMEVLHMAAIFKIHLRIGCFCNPGACQRHLNLTNQDILNNYDAGFTCGGAKDLINGIPTGAVRISFGYMSTLTDVETLLMMIRKCFLVGPEVQQVPRWFKERCMTWQKHHCYNNYNENLPNFTLTTKQINLKTGLINNQQKMDRINERRDKEGLILTKLFIYPIKSCAAFEITDTWLLTDKGLQYDREWMIITSAGICLTQKNNSNLCLLKPTICLNKNVMTLEYPGMPGTEVPIDLISQNIIDGTMCRSRVCGHRVEGIDCGMDIAEWLSLALGQPNLRLVRQSNARNINDKLQPQLTFASQAQYLLINEASIGALIECIPEDSDCDKNGVLQRFRGNIVVQGGKAFEEESWQRLTIGTNAFEVTGLCTRCQMVCIDQQTGLKTIEPLRLLAEKFHGKIKFGIYLNTELKQTGRICIGDSVMCESI